MVLGENRRMSADTGEENNVSGSLGQRKNVVVSPRHRSRLAHYIINEESVVDPVSSKIF
jgi:hypothetical protein